MSKPKQTKPGGKPGQRARKLDQPRSRQPDQAPSLQPARQPDVIKPIEATIAAPGAFSTGVAALANTASIDIQTIALAYGEYFRKSLEQTWSFVEKLSGVRSLDKAIEIQTEFAKQAYETFVMDAQKIRGLYSGFARHTFEGAVANVIPAAR